MSIELILGGHWINCDNIGILCYNLFLLVTNSLQYLTRFKQKLIKRI